MESIKVVERLLKEGIMADLRTITAVGKLLDEEWNAALEKATDEARMVESDGKGWYRDNIEWTKVSTPYEDDATLTIDKESILKHKR